MWRTVNFLFFVMSLTEIKEKKKDIDLKRLEINKLKNNKKLKNKNNKQFNFYFIFHFFFFFLLFLILIISCILCYYYQEKWNIIESLYYSIAIFSSIGSSEYPQEKLSRQFSIVFIIIGQIYFLVISMYLSFYSISNQIIKFKLINMMNKEKLQSLSLSNTHVLGYFCLLLLWIVLGTIFLIFNENWNIIQSLYWCVMTSMMIGTDGSLMLELSHHSTRIFAVVYIIITYFLTFNLIMSKILSILHNTYITNRIEYLSSNQLNINDFPEFLDKISFLCIMLTKKYGINRESVCDKWLQIFDEINGCDGENKLEAEDIRYFIESENSKREIELANQYTLFLQFSPYASLSKNVKS